MQLKINQYDTVEIGEYNGKWQIRVGYINKNGEFKPHFQAIRKKDGSEIKVPVSLTFDSESDKMAFLRMCADEMGCELVEKQPQPTEDVPF